MNLSEFSVKNSLLVNCLSLFLIVAGLFAVFNLEREAFPNLSFDIVTVRTDYLGAAPSVIESRITLPLEKQLKDVDGLSEMGSISIENMSLVILKIDPDAEDKNQIITNIQKAVDQTSDLPEDLPKKPVVSDMKTRNTPILEVSLSGEMSEEELRKSALHMEDRLLDLPGVSSIARKGLKDQEIWIEISQKSMADLHLSLPEIMLALSQHNVNLPGGVLQENNGELLIRTSGELDTTRDIESVVIRANDEGNWIQVGDIAKVRQRLEKIELIHRTDGTRSINLVVVKKDNADAIDLKTDVQNLLDDFKKSAPASLQLAIVHDVSYYIKRRLNVLISNGWMGFILVMIPMVLFLSTRVAIGALVSIPIALATTFACMKFFGVSINLISMFGLIMVMGMLVDEEVVVAENIARHLENGATHTVAAIRGTSEVALPILATALSTIIAFVPLLFMQGIMGKFMSDIPKVVIITLSASLLQAILIMPSHLSDLHRTGKNKNPYQFQKKGSHHFFDRIKKRYERGLRYCLKHAGWCSFISLSLCGLVLLYGFLGLRYGITRTRFILFPSKGIEAFFIRVETDMGTQLEVTESRIVPLEKLVASLPRQELDHYVTQIGITQENPQDPYTNRGSHLAQVQVYLTPETQRDRSANEIMEALRQSIPQIEGFLKISFEPVKPGPPQGKPVEVRLRGDDFPLLLKLADDLKSDLKEINGLRDINDDDEEGKGELHIIVDEKKATQAGLTIQEIASQVRIAFDGGIATIIRRGDEEINVRVIMEEDLKKSGKLDALLIANKKGALVPLYQVAKLEKGPGVEMIRHLDGKRTVSVTANVDETRTTSNFVHQILQEKFSNFSALHPGITVQFGGEAKDTAESLASLREAFLLALLMILLLLLVTFGSMTQTLALIFIIPFGMIGVVIGFAFLDQPLTFLAMLGVVGLTGVAVDGGILLFTFINSSTTKHEDLKEKIVEACLTRFRPILLTTATTVLAVIPAAYGIGGNDPFIAPMALAMNWGLISTLVFTLFAIPSLYLWMDRLRNIWRGRSESHVPQA